MVSRSVSSMLERETEMVEEEEEGLRNLVGGVEVDEGEVSWLSFIIVIIESVDSYK